AIFKHEVLTQDHHHSPSPTPHTLHPHPTKLDSCTYAISRLPLPNLSKFITTPLALKCTPLTFRVMGLMTERARYLGHLSSLHPSRAPKKLGRCTELKSAKGVTETSPSAS